MNLVSIEEAAKLLTQASRILVLGCSGSGKSTLSQKLEALLGLQHISMDKDVLWLPGRNLREPAEMSRLVEEYVQGDSWVIDGTHPRTLPLRLPRTQVAIWMRPPRLQSVWGVVARWLRLRGQVRPEMAEGCPEKMDLEFLSYVWNFERDQSPRVEEQFALNGKNVPVLVLKLHPETARLLALLEKQH